MRIHPDVDLLFCLNFIDNRCLFEPSYLSDQNGGGCLKSPACGAKFPAYLMKPHPDNLGPGDSAQATICFTTGKTCCGKTQHIEIKKCTGFFIYKLPPACLKRGRYCGNGGESAADGSKWPGMRLEWNLRILNA